jgi:cytoskeletal protein CcmA (bactofilin family)
VRHENGKIENQTTLSESLQLHGMWVGNCNVINGAHLQLHGTITGNLTVVKDSTADVHGMVSGNLIANGQVNVAGMVVGHASGEGLTVLPGARVGGR